MVEIIRRFIRAFFNIVSGLGKEGVLSGSDIVKKEWLEVEFTGTALYT